jgi:hypothetical protein
MSESSGGRDRRQAGHEVMRTVLGAPYCERRDASAKNFNAPIRRLRKKNMI